MELATWGNDEVIRELVKEIIDKVELMEIKENPSMEDDNDDGAFYGFPYIRDNSSGSERCRICLESDEIIPIVHLCHCKGSIGSVHLVCLERWFETNNSNHCELCGYTFSVKRVPKYNALTSLWIWLCSNQEEYRSEVRSLRIDILRCLLVTPLTVACSYMCVVAADFYSVPYRNGYVAMFVLIFLYVVWLYITTQYHHRLWFHWWKTTSTVKVIIPEAKEEQTSVLVQAA